MENKGKYMVELGGTKKMFDQCPRSKLKDKVKEAFNLQESFQLQVYDDDFKEWADVTDAETLPLKSRLKVKIGKKRFCTNSTRIKPHLLSRID